MKDTVWIEAAVALREGPVLVVCRAGEERTCVAALGAALATHGPALPVKTEADMTVIGDVAPGDPSIPPSLYLLCATQPGPNAWRGELGDWLYHVELRRSADPTRVGWALVGTADDLARVRQRGADFAYALRVDATRA